MTDWADTLELAKDWIAGTRESDVLELAYRAIKKLMADAPADMKSTIETAYVLRRTELWKAKK